MSSYFAHLESECLAERMDAMAQRGYTESIAQRMERDLGALLVAVPSRLPPTRATSTHPKSSAVTGALEHQRLTRCPLHSE